MDTGKDILLKNKPLAEWWISVANDNRFSEVIALVRSDLCFNPWGREEFSAANSALNALAQIVASDRVSTEMPKSGIIHTALKK
jgi:hypothetical protein